MPSLDVEIEFEIFCTTCGSDLGNVADVATTRSGAHHIKIEACETCVEKATETGDDAGYERGKEDGIEEATPEEKA